jgi:hypothetical protein
MFHAPSPFVGIVVVDKNRRKVLKTLDQIFQADFNKVVNYCFEADQGIALITDPNFHRGSSGKSTNPLGTPPIRTIFTHR